MLKQCRGPVVAPPPLSPTPASLEWPQDSPLAPSLPRVFRWRDLSALRPVPAPVSNGPLRVTVRPDRSVYGPRVGPVVGSTPAAGSPTPGEKGPHRGRQTLRSSPAPTPTPPDLQVVRVCHPKGARDGGVKPSGLGDRRRITPSGSRADATPEEVRSAEVEGPDGCSGPPWRSREQGRGTGEEGRGVRPSATGPGTCPRHLAQISNNHLPTPISPDNS